MRKYAQKYCPKAIFDMEIKRDIHLVSRIS